ncbi:hypothetical protein ACQ4M3_03415 [Leptolyngbya sp. AN03gr2]|uniref:hypothetical protein n=1 Tax=unclassified Leptolyngbya TaxID=2650499 RepID=UPI003D320816
MILLQSDEAILHIEFQTLPKEEIPFRKLDYRVRGKRRYKTKTMQQVDSTRSRGKGRGEKAKRDCLPIIHYEKAFQLMLLRGLRDYRSMKFNNSNNN